MLMKTRTEGDQNLLKVAQALRESPRPQCFTMAQYAQTCRTPSCAFGHYAYRRDLQSILRLSMSGEPLYAVRIGNAVKGDCAAFTDREIHAHFEITEGEASDLFGSYGCGYAQTALQAAEWIEGFVAKRVAAREI